MQHKGATEQARAGEPASTFMDHCQEVQNNIILLSYDLFHSVIYTEYIYFLLNVFSLYDLTPRYLVTDSKMLDVKKHVASGLFTSLESYLQLVCLHIVCLYCRLLKRENT